MRGKRVRGIRQRCEVAPSTRETRRFVLRRFFQWAVNRGLTVETINRSVLHAYAAETMAPAAASRFLTPVRGLWRGLIAAGVPVDRNALSLPVKATRSSATMSKEEFTRISKRIFGEQRGRKKRIAAAFDRRWNTVWSYEAGRRAIPTKTAELFRELDRALDDAKARIDAETPEESQRSFLRIMASLDAAATKSVREQQSFDAD